MGGFDQGGGPSTPIGPAAGDLAGSYPDPTVAKIGGVDVTLAAGATGDVLTQQVDGSYAPQAGGAATPAVPIGDPTGVDHSVTYDDPSSGNPVTVLTFPADTTAIALALAGDAFPRLVLRPADAAGFLHMGDGTVDPVTTGAYLSYDPAVGPTLVGPNGQIVVGFPDANAGPVQYNNTGIQVAQAAILLSGAGDPNGGRGGNVGDLFIRTDGGALTTIYRCTLAGDAATATWVGIL